MPLGSKGCIFGNSTCGRSLGGANCNVSCLIKGVSVRASAFLVADFVTPLAPLRNLNHGYKLARLKPAIA